MGKKKIVPLRVVLDTNLIVSALLFTGVLSEIVELWKKGMIVPLFSEETFREFTTTLAYPKFSLKQNEIQKLIEEEIVPYFEFTEIVTVVNDICRDPDDDKFLSSALSASLDFIVSGDKALLEVGQYKGLKIITPQKFLRLFK